VSNLIEDNLCPFCGATVDLSAGHSCQDSELNEHFRMQADKRGYNDIRDFKDDVRKYYDEGDFDWGLPYEEDSIIKKD